MPVPTRVSDNSDTGLHPFGQNRVPVTRCSLPRLMACTGLTWIVRTTHAGIALRFAAARDSQSCPSEENLVQAFPPPDRQDHSRDALLRLTEREAATRQIHLPILDL